MGNNLEKCSNPIEENKHIKLNRTESTWKRLVCNVSIGGDRNICKAKHKALFFWGLTFVLEDKVWTIFD